MNKKYLFSYILPLFYIKCYIVLSLYGSDLKRTYKTSLVKSFIVEVCFIVYYFVK